MIGWRINLSQRVDQIGAKPDFSTII